MTKKYTIEITGRKTNGIWYADKKGSVFEDCELVARGYDKYNDTGIVMFKVKELHYVHIEDCIIIEEYLIPN